MVRENYGVSSFDYGHDPAGNGTWRYGLTNAITVEAHGGSHGGTEQHAGFGLAAGCSVRQASFLLPPAYSDTHGQSGSLKISLGVTIGGNDRVQFFDRWHRDPRRGYRDVASFYGQAPPRFSGHGVIGYNTDALGSFGLGYVHLRYPGQDATRYGNAYWFKSIGHSATLNLSINQNLDVHKDRSLFFGVTLALDHNTSVSAGASQDNGHNRFTVNANHPTPNDSGFGWRADVDASPGQSGGRAELDYLGRYGRIVHQAVSAFADSHLAYADFTGSLVFMGGHLFAAPAP